MIKTNALRETCQGKGCFPATTEQKPRHTQALFYFYEVRLCMNGRRVINNHIFHVCQKFL